MKMLMYISCISIPNPMVFLSHLLDITPGPNLDQVDPTRHDMLLSWTSTSRSNLQVCTVELRRENKENMESKRKVHGTLLKIRV